MEGTLDLERRKLLVTREQLEAQAGVIRKFETGATRDTDTGKNDYEGFLSPLVLMRFGDYMTEHRKQSDGSLRDSDNWQKGIPLPAYIKSLVRHTLAAWALWRGWNVPKEKIGGVMRQPTLEECLCGVMFNAMGMLHELLKKTAYPVNEREGG